MAVLTVVIVLGIYLVSQDHTIAGIVLSVSGVVSFAMILKGLINNQPRILIDDDGITATEFDGIKILWTDIQKVNVIGFPRVGRIITLELYDEAKYLMQFTEKQRPRQRIGRLLAPTSFIIMAEGLDAPPGVIYKEIMNHIDRSISG
jgi:hypothetical protein